MTSDTRCHSRCALDVRPGRVLDSQALVGTCEVVEDEVRSYEVSVKNDLLAQSNGRASDATHPHSDERASSGASHMSSKYGWCEDHLRSPARQRQCDRQGYRCFQVTCQWASHSSGATSRSRCCKSISHLLPVANDQDRLWSTGRERHADGP